MGLICKWMGHDWLGSRCRRCGKICKHENTVKLDECNDRCTVCGMLRKHHKMEPTDRPGYSACTVCGYEHFNSYDYDRWQEKHQAAERGKKALRNYLKYHQELEGQRGVGQEQFLCAACGKVLHKKLHNVTYPAIPLCTNCVRKLWAHDGHLTFDQTHGHTTTRICIHCWKNEEWGDSRHETQLLQERPCGAEAFTGTPEELMKEED